jgi:predicted lipoprotein with Yx(FWY)xxD motif
MSRSRNWYSLLAVVAVLAAISVAGVVSATASATTKRETRASVVISTRKVGKLGTVLVNSKGLTLYMFVPDKRKRVTCVRACAVIWPPVKVALGAKIVAKGKAKQKLLGSDRDPAGGRVVTYHGWPLYTYISDKRPGQATGQALNLNGGLWYVVAASGKVIHTKLAT